MGEDVSTFSLSASSGGWIELIPFVARILPKRNGQVGVCVDGYLVSLSIFILFCLLFFYLLKKFQSVRRERADSGLSFRFSDVLSGGIFLFLGYTFYEYFILPLLKGCEVPVQ